MDFRNRVVSQRMLPFFHRGKAIVLVGARQVGKTTLLQNLIKEQENVLWLNADEDRTRNLLDGISIEGLHNLLASKKFLVIDEIQRVENAGLLLKLIVDNFKSVQTIACGSSALEISEKIFEPLTGRHFLFQLYPFTIPELYPDSSSFEIMGKLEYHLVYGSYPEVSLSKDIAEVLLTNLNNQYLYKDVLIWKDIRKPELLQKLLQLLAYQVGSEVSINELAKSLKVKSETIENYLDLLIKSYVIFRLSSYSSNHRKEVTKMSKIYFWDNGIRNAIIEDFNPFSNRQDVGLLFENFVVSERIKHNSNLGLKRKSYFWRDYNKKEVDYVEIENGQMQGFEVKWNMNKNHKVTRSFTSLYPDANIMVITPENISDLWD